ncbi:hypothetical protein WMY93_013665 [Mugilogobius chulae]|uniref:Ig-like domain-containing protein n=1 Tax=Mugilogobius chulae TaxID=88201 RepID=A0AAW0P6P3_9GOBI
MSAVDLLYQKIKCKAPIQNTQLTMMSAVCPPCLCAPCRTNRSPLFFLQVQVSPSTQGARAVACPQKGLLASSNGSSSARSANGGPPENPYNLSDMSVFWQLTDTKRSVHGFSNGHDQLEDQASLLQGNASLLLRDVVVADEGSYTCFVKVQDYGSAAFFLQVAARYSQPVVTLEPNFNHRPGDEVALTCVAYGGYPQATVVWRDEGGHTLTDNVTTSHVANEQGLFSLTSILTVILEPSSIYSCQLINPLLGEEGKAFVSISGQSTAFPPVALWVTVGLAVCLLVLLIALAAVCRRKIKESCEEARREVEEARELEEEDSKTAMARFWHGDEAGEKRRGEEGGERR